MLQEHESLIYENFVELVCDCDLGQLMDSLASKEPVIVKLMENIQFEEDCRHNNRLILFQLFKINSNTFFYEFIQTLREHNYKDLANKLQNGLSNKSLY